VRLGGHSVEMIAIRLAGFGAQVTVTGPEEARQCLARVGRELTETYR
jgi:hypothetical protein